jgi:hypothetical protein
VVIDTIINKLAKFITQLQTTTSQPEINKVSLIYSDKK